MDLSSGETLPYQNGRGTLPCQDGLGERIARVVHKGLQDRVMRGVANRHLLDAGCHSSGPGSQSVLIWRKTSRGPMLV